MDLTSILLAIIAGLGFVVYAKSKKNVSLKAEKDLSERLEESKTVDVQLMELDKKNDELEEDLKTDPEEPESFWDEYSKKKGLK